MVCVVEVGEGWGVWERIGCKEEDRRERNDYITW